MNVSFCAGNITVIVKIPKKSLVTDLKELQEKLEDALADEALLQYPNTSQAAAALNVKRSAFYYIRMKHGFPIQKSSKLSRKSK